ncbi:MAG: DUF2062 domain-containing protein [Sphingomonadales bacterium]
MSGAPENKAQSGRKWPRGRQWLNYLWPRMGMRRYAIYLSHKIGRMPGTAHSIAAGFASGAAASMTPFMGIHFLLGALLAWVLRGNLLASAIGTVIGNPWTFPFIWMYTHRFGSWILDRTPARHEPREFSLINAFQDPATFLGPVLLPMIVGSIPVAIVVWFSVYYPLRGAVGRYKVRRIERRHKRAVALMGKIEQVKKQDAKTNDDA